MKTGTGSRPKPGRPVCSVRLSIINSFANISLIWPTNVAERAFRLRILQISDNPFDEEESLLKVCNSLFGKSSAGNWELFEQMLT